MKKKTILRVRTIDCDKSRKSVHDEEITRYIAGYVKFEEKIMKISSFPLKINKDVYLYFYLRSTAKYISYAYTINRCTKNKHEFPAAKKCPAE